MRRELPEIVRCAERLMLEVEIAVKRFTRANRYDYGARLKRKAMKLVALSTRAWWDRPRQGRLTDKLVRRIDQFHALVRLGKDSHAFANFPQFEQIVRTTEELGRQVGGWKKQQHLKSQNPASQGTAAPERAQTLSVRAASSFEAYP